MKNASFTSPTSQLNPTIRGLALAVWILIVLAHLLHFVVDLSLDFVALQTPCLGALGDAGDCDQLAISSAEVAVLSSWGLTLRAYATAMLAAPVILLLGYWLLGGLILRHNLWGIDVIIRKTLVYLLLSGLLVLVYFGTVILLQSIFGSFISQQSPVVIVISTLVIAALFTPLRGRVQAFIDRRFYRQKYDAQQVLAQFAITARDETDMAMLTAELIRVVQETMQPEQVLVWLKPVSAANGRLPDGLPYRPAKVER